MVLSLEGVLGVHNDQGAAEAVRELQAGVGVVPEGPGGGGPELVAEGIAGRDGALGDASDAVGPCGIREILPMPMD